MQVSFDSYKVFYITAKNKSITMAAKELYVTQPTVTHCIQKLEEELGCTLFIRGKKGVKLTPEGKVLYKHVSIACEEIWKAENDMKALKEFKITNEHITALQRTPIHLIANRDDFLVPVHKTLDLQKNFVHAQCSIFDVGAHASTVTEPNITNQALIQFLRSL